MEMRLRELVMDILAPENHRNIHVTPGLYKLIEQRCAFYLFLQSLTCSEYTKIYGVNQLRLSVLISMGHSALCYTRLDNGESKSLP